MHCSSFWPLVDATLLSLQTLLLLSCCILLLVLLLSCWILLLVLLLVLLLSRGGGVSVVDDIFRVGGRRTEVIVGENPVEDEFGLKENVQLSLSLV